MVDPLLALAISSQPHSWENLEDLGKLSRFTRASTLAGKETLGTADNVTACVSFSKEAAAEEVGKGLESESSGMAVSASARAELGGKS